jgi:hypothetical protein
MMNGRLVAAVESLLGELELRGWRRVRPDARR